MESYLGQIMLFAGQVTPFGWVPCDGALLSVDEYPELFYRLRTTYGGDGVRNFAVPDLRGRVPLHFSPAADPSRTIYALGKSGGAERVALTAGQLPLHNHTLKASKDEAKENAPSPGLVPAAVPAGGASKPTDTLFGAGATDASASPPQKLVQLSPFALAATGSGQPHDNVMPFLGLRYLVCVRGKIGD